MECFFSTALGRPWPLLQPLLGHSWVLLDRSWALLGCSWALLGRPWPLLGPSWVALGRSCVLLGRLGPLLTALGPPLAALGPLLGRSWALLGLSWGALGRSWGALGRSWGLLGASWGPLGRSWAVQKASKNRAENGTELESHPERPKSLSSYVCRCFSSQPPHPNLDQGARQNYQTGYTYDEFSSIDFSLVALITREENRSQIGLGRSWSRLARVCGTLAALGPLLGHS